MLAVAAPSQARPPAPQPGVKTILVPRAPGSVAEISLAKLLAYADDHAPVIRTAVARVGRADADVVGADIALPANPELSLAAGQVWAGGASGLNLDVSLTQSLEVAGEPGLRVAAARADRQLALASVDEVRWAVHVDVHRLYVALLLAQERRQLAERFVSFSKALRDTAQRQVAAGESSPLVRLVADTDLAQTRAALIEIARFEQATRAELVALIGWTDDALPAMAGALPPIRRAPEPEALLALMMAHHPSVRVRAVATDALKARRTLAEREAWPEPTVGVNYQHQASPGPTGGAPADMWLLSLSVPLPVWRTAQGERARAEADVAVAERHRDETVVRLRGALLQAALALNAAADRVALYETDVVPQLEQNLNLLQRAYTLGEADVHQVSQTRERLLNATAQYLDARITYFKTAAILEGLVGTELWAERGGAH